MKKITLFLFAALLVKTLSAQQTPIFASNPFPKTITVSGSAEMEVVPDEIYVNVVLKEYVKKGEGKKDIETIKSQFLESCKAVGIPDSAISIASYSGINNYLLRKKKKDPNMTASISYQVKFSNSKSMDDLVDKLDDEATEAFNITSVSHSKIIEFRKQLKIKAMQAAKAKAVYLTESINEKVGEAITISEPTEWEAEAPRYNTLSNTSMGFYKQSQVVERLNENNQEINFKKMKLRYEVNAVFALK